MNVAAHHQPGTQVLVAWHSHAGTIMRPGVVKHIESALDRPYRVAVLASGEYAGHVWSPCAPECVVAA